MDNFTPISALIGGILCGLSAICFFYFNGKTLGISGILEGFIPPFSPWISERIAVIAGLLTGGALLRIFYPAAFDFQVEASFTHIIIAGVLIGLGARLAGGCTSGHGLCGVGRLSPKSLVATVFFFTTGMLTATLFYLFR